MTILICEQAHARARFVLMRLLELEGDGLLTVSEVEPGKNLLLTLQKDRLATDGKKIIGTSFIRSTIDLKFDKQNVPNITQILSAGNRVE